MVTKPGDRAPRGGYLPTWCLACFFCTAFAWFLSGVTRKDTGSIVFGGILALCFGAGTYINADRSIQRHDLERMTSWVATIFSRR